MTARRVRVVIEGDVREVSRKCGILRIDLPADETGQPPVVMVNPDWEGVTVEDVAPSYNWRDGDVVASTRSLNNVAPRANDVWRWSCTNVPITDADVNRLLSDGQVSIVRYQAGDA